MDDDGIDIGKPVPIRVRVIVKGGEMTIDLSEVSRQVRGFYNSGITTGYACAQVAYKCLTSPTDYPINDGSFRSLKTVVPPGRGWGAKHNEDGVSATVCINDGDTNNGPNEQAEAKFPLVVEAYRLVPDSGGAGCHRGGLGVERVIRARTNMTMNTQIERAHCRPWGLNGGLDATGNQVALRLGGTWKTDFPNAKVLVAQLKTGDAFRVRSGGGGGYGSPLERPVADVAADVRQGYVTLEAAAELYGVVVDPDTHELDAAATERLRAVRRASPAKPDVQSA